MAESFDPKIKLYEIISNLQEYNSPEKIEDMKTELKFIKEYDTENSVYIADYGNELLDILNSASPSVVGYVFCFPGVLGGALGDFSSTLRLVPVSTALSGLDLRDSLFYDKAFFSGAYLRNCTFQGCDFTGMDLTGADLSYANLNNAVLTNAKIHGANFTGVSFSGATMPEIADTKTKFKQAVGAGNWHPVTTLWTDSQPIGN